MKFIRACDVILFVMIVVVYEVGGRSWRCVAMAARTDPVELQAVYAMMAATGNGWAASIPDVCVKSGRWHGIECVQDGDYYHVVELSFGLVTDQATAFPSCAQHSFISPAVANLTHLRKLGYFACCMENPQRIPSEIGRLGDSLEALHLRNNGHVGIIPEELAGLIKLRTFDVHGNSLAGTMPIWLSSLTELEAMDISDNTFGGEIDGRTFDNLERLTVFDASDNEFVGALPDSIGRLRTLQKLDLSYNNFTGAIPTTIGDLSRLLSLNLAHNRFSGPLPETMSNLSNLKSLDLQRNCFRVPIPASLGKLVKLEGLVLSGSEFVGPIPSSFGSLSNIRALFLDGNKLTGTIPPALGDLTRVYELELSSNLLAGPVPFSSSFVSRLGRRLRLQNNEGLCYEFKTADSLTSDPGSTIRPSEQPPQLKICSSSSSNNQSVGSSEFFPPSHHPSIALDSVAPAGSLKPAFEPSSACSRISYLSYHAVKCFWFMTFLVIMSRC